MEKNNRFIAVVAAAGILVLIFDGQTALTGAAKGITLCIITLIPSLFPFILLSILLTSSLSGQVLRPLQPITSACKMPNGTESLLAISFLGGYPVGAQNVSLLYQQGQLTASQSMRMLSFCNNAGPAFIFGILGLQFSNKIIPWLLWLIQIFSSLCVGFLLPGAAPVTVRALPEKVRTTAALSQALKAMSQICGWVILMGMVLAFLDSWFLRSLPVHIQVAVSGILELSNGCVRLGEIECEGLRFLIASGLLTFGGICVTLQTASVAEGISMNQYFPGKLLQSSISILLSCLFQFIFPAESRFSLAFPAFILSAGVATIVFFTQYSKKVVAIPK